MALLVKFTAAVATAPIAGASLSVGVLSAGDWSWLIEPRHAMSVTLGLLASAPFRLAVMVKSREDASLWREMAISALAFAANFLLAASLTTTLATRQPPPYIIIVACALLIGVSGTTALQLAGIEFIKRIWGKDEK